ncbi:methyl-CpG-binding domain-containing protein [Orobanche minor]
MAIATTATVATTATAATSDGALQLESIPVVDIRLLSQSEIYALSLCSSSAFDPDRCDDIVIPKIDRSVFNESAGSRKQTYSRLRLAPPSSSSSASLRRRTPHLPQSSASTVNPDNENSDPENGENAHMLPLFKKLFVSDINLRESFPLKIDHSYSLLPHQFSITSDSPPTEGLSGHKRKRSPVRGNETLANQTHSDMGNSVVINDSVDGISSLNEIVVRETLEYRDRGTLNRDGVAVDFVALGLVDHPYWEEIRRRTKGLGSEGELKGFLGGFKGRWGSSRKKKRIVDASEFGTALPIGWKLVLSIEKKDGHAWLSCARYISGIPSGQQFASCKEASSYLLTLTGVQDTDLSTSSQHNEIADDRLTSIRIADIATQDVDGEGNPSSYTTLPVFASTDSNHVRQVMSDARFLPEERVDEILHCDKCNVTFCKKDELLHCRSSIHQRNGYKNVVCMTNVVVINEMKSVTEASDSRDETRGIINSAVENSFSIERPERNLVSDSSFSEKQPTNLEESPCKIVNTVDNTLISASMGSELNLPSNISNLTSSCDEKARTEDDVPCSAGQYIVDEKRCSEADTLCVNVEMQFGFDSINPSWNEKDSNPEKSDSEVSTSLFKELGVQNNSKSTLVAISGPKSNSGADNNDEVCGRKMGVLEYEDIQIDRFANSHMQGNLEQESLFGIDFSDSSLNNRTHELGSSFNTFRQGMDSNVPRRDNLPSSGQNFVVGFRDNNPQSGDFIRDDGSWSTGHEHLYQGCFDPVPNAHVQSSSHFHAFDLTSEKGEQGSFGVSKNPDIHTGNPRPGRSEPVEYSFMGEQSSISLPGESRIFSHDTTIEQGLADPSFCLGNDALMLNIAETNHQSTSVCVWCRSMFYQQQVQTQTGIQTGAIGSLCPSCSTRIPGHF